MHWFFITLAAPFLYALTNHIDKILLEKYFKSSGVNVLILISTLLSSIAIPIFYLQDTSALSLPITTILIMCFVGVLNLLVLWLYLLALSEDEASIVIVFYQLVPVFGVFLGYFILGEVLTNIEIMAMAIIIIGTSIVSFEIDNDNHFRIKKRTIFLMLGASFAWALGSVIFKAMSLEEGVSSALFWEHVSLTTIGLVLTIGIDKFRDAFFDIFRNNSFSILSLNFANESLYMVGNWVFAFSYLLAPVSLILLMNSFQPIFVFIIGIILTLVAPSLGAERIKLFDIGQKLLAITITGIGAYLLVM